jgi:outer membrane lipoprotein-sorting protein
MKNFLFLFSFLFSTNAFSQNNSLSTIVANMNKAVDNLRTAKFTIYGEEKLKNGTMYISERNVKLNVAPQKVYFYTVRPDKGLEVLWKNAPGEKMIINPGGFPYITLKINPNSSVARKDAHHSIEDMGFKYVVGLVNYYMQNYGEKLRSWATVKDTVQWQNHSCIHLVIDFKEYKPFTYTVKKNETLSTIAKKFHVNDYMILSMNKEPDDLEDVDEGDNIVVPNFYGTRIEFYIDMKTWLPIRQLIYDQKGIYEKYEFTNLIYNPVFKADEFSEDYSEYNF